MFLKFIIKNKFIFLSSALILIPYYTWKALYNKFKSLKYEYEKEILFRKRHNCVVMYSGNKGMSGWPPYKERIVPNITEENSVDVMYEPIIYFVNTAKKSLNVALMMIGVNKIYDALIEASKRGVKVKVLLDFESSVNKLTKIKEMMKAGIEVLTYISQNPDLSSIMHYKFMIKDYTESDGYVFVGSLNLTGTGFLSNYEDVVFTSNHYVVTAFNNNFEECWDFVRQDNENLINKTVLLDVNLA